MAIHRDGPEVNYASKNVLRRFGLAVAHVEGM
jgi:hypothetical protein